MKVAPRAQGTRTSGKQQPVTQLVPAGHAEGATPVAPQAIDPVGSCRVGSENKPHFAGVRTPDNAFSVNGRRRRLGRRESQVQCAGCSRNSTTSLRLRRRDPLPRVARNLVPFDVTV